jgi:hypothetical protein
MPEITRDEITLTLTEEQGRLLRDAIVFALSSTREEMTGGSSLAGMANALSAQGLKEASPELVLDLLEKSNELP